MKKININKKTVIITSVVLVLLVAVGIVLNITFSDNGVRVFNNIDLVDQDLGSVRVTKISLENNSKVSSYTATVTAKQDVLVKYIKISMLDEKEDIVVDLYGYIGESLSEGESRVITANTDADLSNVSNLLYEVITE